MAPEGSAPLHCLGVVLEEHMGAASGRLEHAHRILCRHQHRTQTVSSKHGEQYMCTPVQQVTFKQPNQHISIAAQPRTHCAPAQGVLALQPTIICANIHEFVEGRKQQGKSMFRIALYGGRLRRNADTLTFIQP